MKRIWKLVPMALIVVAGCGGSAANVTENEGPDQGSHAETSGTSSPVCGYREGESTRCETDADCGSEESCVAGLGNEIVPEREDGVESMPPYDRESVQYCEPRACESGADNPPVESSEDPPTEEPAP